MGVNLGNVLVGDDGVLRGDGVKIAVSLEDAAEPVASAFHSCLRAKQGQGDSGVRQFRRTAAQELGLSLFVSMRSVRGHQTLRPRRRRLTSFASATPRLSVVVLPFINVGDDSEQDYFVDGVTESLTTDSRASPMPSRSAATRLSPTRAKRSMSARLVTSWAYATSWRERNGEAASGSTRNWSTPSQALISGRNGLTSRTTTSSACRTRSPLGSPAW